MTAIVHWDRCSHLPVTNDKSENLFMDAVVTRKCSFNCLTRNLRVLMPLSFNIIQKRESVNCIMHEDANAIKLNGRTEWVANIPILKTIGTPLDWSVLTPN